MTDKKATPPATQRASTMPWADRLRLHRRHFLKGAGKASAGALLPTELLQVASAIANPVGTLANEAGKVITKKIITGASNIYFGNIRTGLDWISNVLNRDLEEVTEIPRLSNTDLIVRIQFNDFVRGMIEAMRFGFHAQEDRDALIHSPELREATRNIVMWKSFSFHPETLLHKSFDPGALRSFITEGHSLYQQTLKGWGIRDLPLDKMSDSLAKVPGWTQFAQHEKLMTIFEMKFLYHYGLPSGAVSPSLSLDIARRLKAEGILKIPDIGEMLAQFGPATIEKAFIASRALHHELAGLNAEEAQAKAQDEYDRNHKETYFEIVAEKTAGPSRRTLFTGTSTTFTVMLTDPAAPAFAAQATTSAGHLCRVPGENGIAPVMHYLRSEMAHCAGDFRIELPARAEADSESYLQDNPSFIIHAHGKAREMLTAIMQDRVRRVKDRLPVNCFYEELSRMTDTANWLTLAAALRTRTPKASPA